MIDARRRAVIVRARPDQPARRPGHDGGDPGAGSAGPGADERIRQRLWLTVCCLALAVLTFVDRPGKIVADTKLDMAVNPVGFLIRALHVWDPAQFGQVQNQAAGYYFPMGPFFALGKLAALPPWVVQRLWMTAVVLAAFLGVVRLAARLGIGTPATRLAAGFVYALSPSALTLLGVLSAELLPAAMAPWILIPIVNAVRDSSSHSHPGLFRMQAAARSATAVAFCGGINGTAAIAAVLPAAIYLVLAPGRAQRLRIFAWWAPAVLLATWWWLYPLATLQKFGSQFLLYTESAQTTTSVTSLSDMLRGTEDWTSYLIVNGRAWWPIGLALSTGAVATVATGVIAGAGLAGLLRRDLAARRSILWILLFGIAVIATGYVSGLGNPLASHLDQLINGPLAAFRNLRKFDPLIRLPLALGVAHLLASAGARNLRRVLCLGTGAAVAALSMPAFVGGLSTPGAIPAIPAYWVSTANWINKHAANQGVLALPGARFGQYQWGQPMDDVLEALDKGNWASRQLNYIGSAGLSRTLAAIDQVLAAGQGSAGLSQVLSGMGVKYLVVRNDLLRSDLHGAWPARVNQALSESPGLVKVARFGSPPAGGAGSGDAVGSFDTPYPPVEIYRVTGAQPVATVVPADSAMRVYGAPEAVLALADQGLLRNRPVLLNADSPGLPARRTVLTDTLRRRVRNFGELRTNFSPTLTATAPASTFAAAADFLVPGWSRFFAVSSYAGIADVSASSSDADITSIPEQNGTGRLPFAALDGDLRTMWESGGLTGPVGQWLRIDFDRPVNPGSISVAFADSSVIGPQVTRVAISSATGSRVDTVRVTGAFQQLRVPAGPSPWLRVTVTRIVRTGTPVIGRQVGIVDIRVPGVAATRWIVAPRVSTPGAGNPDAVVLAKAEPRPADCMLTSWRWVCSPSLLRPAEEQYGFHHAFALASAEQMSLTGSTVLVAPSLIDAYARIGPHPTQVTGSSSYTADPQVQPLSAFDGNPATTWVSGRYDRQPALAIRWRHRVTVSTVTVSRPPGASGPIPVLITGSAGQVRGGYLSGPLTRLTFRPIRTNSLTIRFTPQALPVQISDLSVPGVNPAAVPGNAAFRLPCGLGPDVSFDGKLIRTRVAGTFAALLTGQPMAFAACSAVTAAAGRNQVTEPAADAFDVQAIDLNRAGPGALSGGASARPVAPQVIRWTAGSRVLRVRADRRSYLVVHQNFSQGWIATMHGTVLRPVRLDGWQQAWVLPARTTGLVTLTFAADAGYRLNVAGGLAAVLLIMIIAFVPWRRQRHDGVPPAGQAVQAGAGGERQPGHTGLAGRWRADLFARLVVPWRRPRGWLRRSVARYRPTVRPIAIAVTVCAFGFWLGGYPGALLLPLAVAFFLVVPGLRRDSRLSLAPASPWLAGGMLAIASVAGAAGLQLRNSGTTSWFVAALWDTGPQVLCLVIAGQLIAALCLPDGGGAPEPASEPG